MSKKNNKYSKGVSIIEALLAAVIVGIGFISVYTMTTTATRMIYSASQRDNDTLSTAMIMDDMALDNFSVADTGYHESISSSKYNNLDLTKGCGAAPTGTPKQKDRQKVRWCNFLKLKKFTANVIDGNVYLNGYLYLNNKKDISLQGNYKNISINRKT